MRITILTLTYLPEPAEQIHDLAKHFLKQNHCVTIITCLPSYPHGKIYNDYRSKLFDVRYLDGIKIIRVPVFPSQSSNALHRMLYYMTFSISTIMPVIFTKTDVFIAYHPPPSVIIPIFLNNVFNNKKFIYWINDMWPETLEVVGVNKRILNLINKIHSYIYSKASKIIVLSDGFKENLIQKNVSTNKITVIHNWISTNDFKLNEIPRYIYTKYNIYKNKFYVIYAGSQGKMQELDVVIRSFKYLKSYPKIKLILLGTGTEHNNLKKLVISQNLTDKVFIHGRVPDKDLIALYGIAATMIIHLKSLSINNITIPHKIYGYMAAKKPIIGAINGDAANEIKKSNSGYTCSPGNPKQISNLIINMYNNSKEKRRVLGLNGYKFVTSKRNINIQGGEFEKIIKQI